MRISIDASSLGGGKTGTAVYLIEILNVWNKNSSISHEFVIFANREAQVHLSRLDLDFRFHIIPTPKNRYLRTLWQQLILPLIIKSENIDVHWGPSFILPLFSAVPMVVTVHDLTFKLFPVVHEWIKRYYFPVMINAAVKKAASVIAISESTHKDLLELVPYSVNKTIVTLLAARSIGGGVLSLEQERLLRDEGDYLLFVGTVEPRKNLSRLLDAWLLLDNDIRGSTKLFIVGALGWMVRDLFGRFESTDSVHFLGYVTDSELAVLMKNAKAFVYPSLYEGFGLPVLEAMALGVPVMTSNVGATQEVVEDSGLLVDPLSVHSIHNGLTNLLMSNQLRAALSVAGLRRASLFSWQKTAGATLNLMEEAYANELKV